MNNLFSTFDPTSWMSAPLNWLSSFVVICSIPPIFWASTNQSIMVFKSLMNNVYKEFKAIMLPHSNPGLIFLPISLFILILLNNAFGLIPYMFTSSSHMIFTMGMAIPLWVGHMVMGALKSPTSMLAHLVPLGTPPVLMPFMVLIEMISSIIRPLTLSVRLAANMIAGHLLLALMAGQGPNLSLSILLLLLSGLVLLGTLECAVSMIQAYVFSVLSSLYLNEVNSLKLN